MSRPSHLIEVPDESRRRTPDGTPRESAQERVDWVLQQSAVRKVIESNQRFAEEIKAAASCLTKDLKIPRETLERAVLKSADAIVYGIKIFISYKTSEEDTARGFLSLLNDVVRLRASNKKPFPFLAGDKSSITAGEDWREKVHDALESTHWFFLLKPDETADPDWLVFEAGFFRRGMLPSDKLICIHGTNTTVPDQIKNLQAVKATEDKLHDLLESLVIKPHAIPGMEAIDSEINKNTLQRTAREMAALFVRDPEPELKRRYFVNSVDLCLSGVDAIATGDDLRRLRVLQVEGSEQVFGRPFQTATFGELISNLDRHDKGNKWVEQLASAVGEAFANRSLTQPTISFRGYRDRRMYRPFMHAARIYEGANRPHSVHIAFIEDVAAPVRMAPPTLAALETALRLSYRFRWEILAEYNHPLTVGDLEEIERIIASMDAEAQQRGLYDPETLASAFPDALANQLRQNYEEYKKYQSDPPGTGEMDRAFRDKDPKMLARSLREIGKMTCWFLKVGSRVYADLTERSVDIF